MLRKEIYTLHDVDGMIYFDEVVKTFGGDPSKIKPTAFIVTFMFHMQTIRDAYFNIHLFSDMFGHDKFKNLLKEISKYYVMLQLNDSQFEKICQMLYKFITTRHGKYLCHNKKEVTMMNWIQSIVIEKYIQFIIQFLINTDNDIQSILILLNYNPKRLWSIRGREFKSKPDDIIYNDDFNIDDNVECVFNIQNSRHNICRQMKQLKSPDKFKVKPDLSTQKINYSTRCDMNISCKNMHFKSKIINTKLDYNTKKITNDKMPMSRDMAYLYSRIEIGYIPRIDSIPIPSSKNNNYDDRNNRIFTSAISKYYYRNGKQVLCRVQECNDNIHIIIEPEKKYASALLMVNKYDVGYLTSQMLKIDFKKAKRFYHTKNNIEKIMQLVK